VRRESHAQFYERPEVQFLRPTHHHNHRVRDGSMGEDASKIRINPGIAARLKSFALNLGRANGIDNIQHGFWLNLQDVASVCTMKGV
jgi:hypothetical protein